MDTETHATSALEAGDMARDLKRQVHAEVMGNCGGRIQLRPLRGGREWDALPEDVVRVDDRDLFSERVRAANRRSRGEL